MISKNHSGILTAIVVVDHPLVTALDLVLVPIHLHLSKRVMGHTIQNPIHLFRRQNGDIAKKTICVCDMADPVIGRTIALCADPLSFILKNLLNAVLSVVLKRTRKGLLSMQLSPAHVQIWKTLVLRSL